MISLLLLFHFAYAGTGTAKDETLFIIVLITFLLVILAILYSLSLLKNFYKRYKEKKLHQAEIENIHINSPDTHSTTENPVTMEDSINNEKESQ